jgi:RimJ/RimL family protein N-acetyltransferase
LLGYRAPDAHQNLEQTPETMILFFLDCGSNYLEVGQALLEHSLAKLRALGVSTVKWNFDSAEFWGEILRPCPHWEQQRELAHCVGMSLRQEKLNYLYRVCAPAVTDVASDMICRTLQEVGEADYIEAIRRTMRGTPDRIDAQLCHRLGPEKAARHFFDNISDGMTYEPRLWKLGYNAAGVLIGLVAPLKMWGDVGTLGYIGVVPEHRGKGYGVALLQQGTADLQIEGIQRIVADTDAHNVPMQRTFEKAGYQLQGRNRSYETCLSDTTRSLAYFQ